MGNERGNTERSIAGYVWDELLNISDKSGGEQRGALSTLGFSPAQMSYRSLTRHPILI